MENRIDPDRLRQLRNRKGKDWTQEKLAKKAGLAKQSIYRLEKGQQPGGRKQTLDGLCKALGVDEDVLTGKAPMPEQPRRKDEPSSRDFRQLNVRVSGQVRNALFLAARRYGVDQTKIIELAPLLFTIIAENSLESWRKKVDGEISKVEEARGVPGVFVNDGELEDYREGVNARGLFDFEDGNEAFLNYLKNLSSNVNKNIVQITSYETYYICIDDVIAILGKENMEQIEMVLRGRSPIKMPSGILNGKTPDDQDARVQWIKENAGNWAVEEDDVEIEIDGEWR